MKSGKGSRKSLEEVFCCRCSNSSSDLILIFTVEVLLRMTQCSMGQDSLA